MIAAHLSLHGKISLALLNRSERRHFEPVTLSADETIQRMHAPLEHVYFLTRGAVSLLRATSPGEQIEIATVGPEGMLGWPVSAETNPSPYTATVLVPGDAFRIPIAAMREEVDASPTWRRFVESEQAAIRRSRS